MAVANYGVLLGTKAGYHRDAPNAFGKFFHGHIDVQTPGQLFNTAIDVDSERPGVQVQWRVVHLRVQEWQSVFGLLDGYHALSSDDSSGAVDYYRDPRLRSVFVVPDYKLRPIDWWRRWAMAWQVLAHGFAPSPGVTSSWAKTVPGPGIARPSLLASRLHVIDITPPWKIGTDVQALSDLEGMIVDAARVVIFGAFYPASQGRLPGLHDIHQNQGDPPTSTFAHLDAIWQDGLTIAIHSDGTASAFMNKFSTQSEQTDAQGRPI